MNEFHMNDNIQIFHLFWDMYAESGWRHDGFTGFLNDLLSDIVTIDGYTRRIIFKFHTEEDFLFFKLKYNV